MMYVGMHTCQSMHMEGIGQLVEMMLPFHFYTGSRYLIQVIRFALQVFYLLSHHIGSHRSNPFLKYLFLFMCMCVYLRLLQVCRCPVGFRIENWVPWSRSYIQLIVLGPKLGSSGKAIRAFNNWVLSSVPQSHLIEENTCYAPAIPIKHFFLIFLHICTHPSLFFFDKILLCSLVLTGTHREPPTSASEMLGLKARTFKPAIVTINSW